MATRRESREWAIQLLFQVDMNPGVKLDGAFADFWLERDAPRPARNFAEQLVRGVVENREVIDEKIRAYTEHWDIGRMAVLDRNVVRMAIYEMLYREDIPPVVSINEAVDLAKYFSSTESGKFVNGILDRARKELSRPSRTAGQDA